MAIFKNQAPAVSHECLMHAQRSRQMWSAPCMRNAQDRFADARHWLERARLWRLQGQRELELNAAWLKANPAIAKHYGLKVS